MSDGSESSWPAELVGDPVEIAPLLLGGMLLHGGVAMILTEVEAYGGDQDPASHAFRGRTPRNAPMFGPPGHLYVYLSYGIHRAANIVTTPDGVAGGVLLRSGRVVAGLELATERRPGIVETRLARGPGNLGRCLAFSLDDSGSAITCLPSATNFDLAAVDPALVRFIPHAGDDLAVSHGPRVGVGAAQESPFRFWLAGDPTISTYRRARDSPGGTTP